MKSKDHSLGDPNRKSLLYRPSSASHTETAVFGTLGVVSLAALGIALTWGTVPANSHTSPLSAYFSSGQAAADLRTANAAVQYLMDPELPTPTNLIECSPTQKNLAMPTNAAVAKPNV